MIRQTNGLRAVPQIYGNVLKVEELYRTVGFLPVTFGAEPDRSILRDRQASGQCWARTCLENIRGCPQVGQKGEPSASSGRVVWPDMCPHLIGSLSLLLWQKSGRKTSQTEAQGNDRRDPPFQCPSIGSVQTPENANSLSLGRRVVGHSGFRDRAGVGQSGQHIGHNGRTAASKPAPKSQRIHIFRLRNQIRIITGIDIRGLLDKHYYISPLIRSLNGKSLKRLTDGQRDD